MMADTLEELNAMADKIGMKRSWFQQGKKGSADHYDLVASKRKLAVSNGAIELNSWKEAADKINELKK